jgi:hypothetical protein
MKDKTSGSRRLRRARPLHAGILAVMAGTVLFSAACSSNASGSPSASSSSTASSNYAKALAYAQCVRTHGVPGFPDPNSQGVFAVAGNFTKSEEAALASAKSSCQSLLPNGGQVPQSTQQQRLSQLLKFSQCMRSHGVPSFPDPKTNPVSLNLRGSGIDPNSPAFQTAQQQCRNLMPTVGGTQG